jgi:transposase InsO family protein
MGTRFVDDTLDTGRGIRVQRVVDAFTRECLGLDVDTRLSSRRVTRTLDQIIEETGHARKHSLRQRTRTNQPARPRPVHGQQPDSQSTWEADAERTCGELQR